MTLFTDYHMHPQGHRHLPYTLDLLAPWADSCRSKGITDFAVTDHDRYCEGVNFDILDQLREQSPDLKIRAGIELDNDPVTSAAGRRWVEKNWERLDFVLGSAHYFTDEELMFDSSDQAGQFQRLGVERAYELYFHEIERMIYRGHIDCLAHLDLVKIHKFYLPGLETPAEVFRPLLELIKRKDLSMEISTAGWRKPVGEQYPELGILKQAVAMGIPLTVASDAHSHVQVGENYDRLGEIIHSIGLKEVAIYDKHRRTMKPI